jgi:hypothetical protein
MKNLLLTILIPLALFIQGCSTSTNSSKTSVLLILYSYPTEWQKNNDLERLREATDGKFVSVINPSNGPGYSRNETFVEGIEYLYNQNITVVSYIYTSFGYRDKQEIYDEIDAYADFYGTEKLSGIFFDEIKLKESDDEEFLKDISTYAKSKNFNFIVINPGAPVEQSLIDENFYDIIVTFENPYDEYKNFKNSNISSTKTKQALVLYDCPDLPSYSDEIKKAKSLHFDYIYLTIDGGDNPWDSIFNFLK